MPTLLRAAAEATLARDWCTLPAPPTCASARGAAAGGAEAEDRGEVGSEGRGWDAASADGRADVMEAKGEAMGAALVEGRPSRTAGPAAAAAAAGGSGAAMGISSGYSGWAEGLTAGMSCGLG